MNDKSITSILDRPSNAAEPPPAWPVGHYLCVVVGLPKFDVSSQKKTPYAEFTYKPVQALDDVDQEALAEFGGLGEKTIKDTYYLTDASEWRLREALDNMGIVDEENGTPLSHNARIALTPNASVVIQVVHEASQDGKRIFAKVGGTAKAE